MASGTIRVAAVVPTCRGFKIPEQTIPVDWYIVHDRQEWPVDGEAKHIVSPDSEMFGEGSSSIRSAGILEAYRDGAEFILTVDDDCFIPPDWAEQHVEELLFPKPLWSNTIEGPTVRGYPEDPGLSPVAISHGLWDGIPDLYGDTQINLMETIGGQFYRRHRGVFGRITGPFPMSSMNVGFPREVIPSVYFFPMGGNLPFDRFEDIWGGLVAQRILSEKGYSFSNGGAIVYHQRASNPVVNEQKEAPGREIHDALWRHIWKFSDPWNDLEGAMVEMSYHLKRFDSGRDEWNNYFNLVSRNMRSWVRSLEAASAY